MQKTKIEWTDYTWNPIKGLCPVGCWYCYARAIYKRFRLDEKLRFSYVDLMNLKRTPFHIKKPSKIFVCSTMEMFRPEVKSLWRDQIFNMISECPQHTFQILTKFPQNIDREMPPNVWLGVSVTKSCDLWRLRYLEDTKASLKFISIEPMLEFIESCDFYFSRNPESDLENISLIDEFESGEFNWLIIGRLTGHGHKYDPKIEDILFIGEYAKSCGISIFLKNNLSGIWPGELIQELPE